MEIDRSSHFQVIHLHIPRIAEGLRLFWGHPEFSTFVNRLMNDSRDGARQGFPVPVAEALLRLSRENEQLLASMASSLAVGPELLPAVGRAAFQAPQFR